MVALLGGNAGAQSLAVVIRSLALGSVAPSRVGRVIAHQVGIGLINSIPDPGCWPLWWGWSSAAAPGFGLTMGAATVANLTVGTLAGTGIPLLLRHLGLDPALASNIFLTLVTDVIGFGGFLLVATLLLR